MCIADSADAAGLKEKMAAPLLARMGLINLRLLQNCESMVDIDDVL
jgi:hypothetical protein